MRRGATTGLSMGSLVWLTTTVVAAVGSGTARIDMSYAEGAPPGFSGGAGEQSCHACHFHAALNAGPGRVALSGVPEQYVAGERYTITVTLTRPGMKLAGFQLTARATSAHTAAGTLRAAPGEELRVVVQAQDGIEYANQTKTGTALTSNDDARWTLVWTAPQSDEPISFFVAANAADGDGTAEGDHVYTAVVEAMPRHCATPLAR